MTKEGVRKINGEDWKVFMRKKIFDDTPVPNSFPDGSWSFDKLLSRSIRLYACRTPRLEKARDKLYTVGRSTAQYQRAIRIAGSWKGITVANRPSGTPGPRTSTQVPHENTTAQCPLTTGPAAMGPTARKNATTIKKIEIQSGILPYLKSIPTSSRRKSFRISDRGLLFRGLPPSVFDDKPTFGLTSADQTLAIKRVDFPCQSDETVCTLPPAHDSDETQRQHEAASSTADERQTQDSTDKRDKVERHPERREVILCDCLAG